MDLRRLKTVFIIILIVIDALLAALLCHMIGQEREVKKETDSSVTAFLQRNMIFLAPDLELPESPEMSDCYLEKMSESNDDFVTKLLGGSYTASEDGGYISGSRSLHIGGAEFRYEDSKPTAPLSDMSASAIEKLCRSELERLDIDSRSYKFNGINMGGNTIKAIFTVEYSGSVFFDSYLSFDISKDGICGISGKNLVSDISVSGRSAKYFKISSILMDIVKNPMLDKNKQHTIVSIKHGYYIGQGSENYRNILAIPVWQIATDSGLILYYDARNGNYIDS